MTGEQSLSFALILGSVAMFAWGRFRYDAISLGALVLGIILGVVPAEEAFTGFASEVVVIIAAALVVSAAIAKSGVVEPVLRPLLKRLKTPKSQVPVLAGATALFSMLSKNVGALATLMPVAVRMGRGKDSNPSQLLMPMSFLSLLGGLVTLVGTSTNIIASEVREKTLGAPFHLFDFAPVGLGLTVVGLIFVSFAWRLLPTDRVPKTGLAEVVKGTAYATEAMVPDEGWPDELKEVADLKLGEHGVTLTGLIGPGGKPQIPFPDTVLAPGAVLMLEGDDEALGALWSRLPLAASRKGHEIKPEGAHEEIRTIEAVVEGHSLIVGQTAGALHFEHRFETKLLALSRRGERIRERLNDVAFQPGDLLLLQASEGLLPTALSHMGVLPLAERDVAFGKRRHRYGPILILVAAMALVAMGVLKIAVAFFTAAFLMIVIGSLSMREAYAALEPEVLILIGALTPLSHAVEANGGTALVAGAMAGALSHAAPLLVVGGLIAVAMACSPFLHNAPTVLVLAPIGALLATQLGINPDAALMAVATGAGCDFVTPIGHQCNTLIRGPGGYRFGDYVRLGAPLSLMVLLVGTPLIAHFWL